MEDTLEVYHRQQDPKRPLVCFDEGSKQLTKETRLPLPPRPGAVAKYDYEYERNGTSNAGSVDTLHKQIAGDQPEQLRAEADQQFPRGEPP